MRLKGALAVVVLVLCGVGLSSASDGDRVKPKKGLWKGTAEPLPDAFPKGEPNLRLKVGKKRVKEVRGALRPECEPLEGQTLLFSLNLRETDGKGRLSLHKKPSFYVFANVRYNIGVGVVPAEIDMVGKFVKKRRAKGWVEIKLEEPGCEESATGRQKWVARP